MFTNIIKNCSGNILGCFTIYLQFIYSAPQYSSDLFFSQFIPYWPSGFFYKWPWMIYPATVRMKCLETPGPGFNMKMSSYQYGKSHCWDKMVIRSYYLHNGISYTGKMSSLYWIRAKIFPNDHFEQSWFMYVWALQFCASKISQSRYVSDKISN